MLIIKRQILANRSTLLMNLSSMVNWQCSFCYFVCVPIISYASISIIHQLYFSNDQQPQPPDTPMSTVSDVTKQELTGGMPLSISSQSSTSRSKPQACKVCGKMLSSASSYYVHMKLHSGTKPFACTVSM